jgi:UTP--glucose-1-phosphate uridylyltransferase
VEAVGESLVEVRDLVEKPSPEEAPSDFGVMGRYVLTPEIFDAIAETRPGRGGEIQLTDAIKGLLGTQKVFGYTFSEGRFDTGNKIDFLKATVLFALERPDLGPEFRSFLEELIGRS